MTLLIFAAILFWDANVNSKQNLVDKLCSVNDQEREEARGSNMKKKIGIIIFIFVVTVNIDVHNDYAFIPNHIAFL